MRVSKETLHRVGTERINMLVDYVCDVYGMTYPELADKLGVNRGWFTRYRNGGIGSWGYMTVVNLVELAAQIDKPTLFHWVFVERDIDIESDKQIEK